MENNERLRYVKNTVIVGFWCGIVCSLPLWLTGKLYPLTPIFGHSFFFAQPYDEFLLSIFLITLGLALVDTKRMHWWLITSVTLGILLITLDQSRLQPWVWHYLFSLGVLSTYFFKPSPVTSTTALNALRLIVAAMYFYSGVQKINHVFVFEIFPWMSSPLYSFFGVTDMNYVYWAAAAVPLFEIAIAVALLTPRWRLLGIGGAGVMLVFVLATLGPLGQNWNSVVWPWNIALFCLVLVLFAKDTKITFTDILFPKHIITGVVFACFMMLPLFSFIDRADSYLSWALYSGNTQKAEIRMTSNAYILLPPEIQAVATAFDGYYMIDPSVYSYAMHNTPAYPEVRVYRRNAEYLCAQAEGQGVNLILYGKSHHPAVSPRSIPCAEL